MLGVSDEGNSFISLKAPMGSTVETAICLVNTTHDEVVNHFAEITNKLVVTVIQILDTPIGVLRKSLLSGFGNLIDLDLSSCTIFTFENHVFEDLVHLATVNFSNNVINSIDSGLFRTNANLKSIIFNNNLLHSINRFAFYTLQNLEVLDLSYNHITILNGEFLNNSSLRELRLNNNYIKTVHYTAFDKCANITYLALDNNIIEQIDTYLLDRFSSLQHLNLNCNRIKTIHPSSFIKLKELSTLYLRNNCLTQCFSKVFFSSNPKLFDLDLSENDVSCIEKYTFDDSLNLMFLNLKVNGNFEISSIKHLTSLTKFELIYLNSKNFAFTTNFWNYLKFKSQLTVLKLVLKQADSAKFCDFSILINLEHLHIEILQPNNDIGVINFFSHFNNMNKVKTLILKRLNFFIVLKCYWGPRKLVHLDLTGIKNTVIDYAFQNFLFLKYLNLSFSEIKCIIFNAFDKLEHLEHLVLEFSKISFINRYLLRNNSKLRILNCANCRIETIQYYSFFNLHNLETLDLRNNCLRNISEYTFFGLNMETCTILL